MKNEQLENAVITLHGQGWSIRRISRELGVSRGRIRRLLTSNADIRDTAPEPVTKPRARASKMDPYKEFTLLDIFLQGESVNCWKNTV